MAEWFRIIFNRLKNLFKCKSACCNTIEGDLDMSTRQASLEEESKDYGTMKEDKNKDKSKKNNNT